MVQPNDGTGGAKRDHASDEMGRMSNNNHNNGNNDQDESNRGNSSGNSSNNNIHRPPGNQNHGHDHDHEHGHGRSHSHISRHSRHKKKKKRRLMLERDDANPAAMHPNQDNLPPPPPFAAAAAAALPQQQPQHDPLLQQLLHHVQLLNAAQGQQEVDVQKAQLLLDASSGNIAEAAKWYWDDYFATAAVQMADAAAVAAAVLQQPPEVAQPVVAALAAAQRQQVAAANAGIPAFMQPVDLLNNPNAINMNNNNAEEAVVNYNNDNHRGGRTRRRSTAAAALAAAAAAADAAYAEEEAQDNVNNAPVDAPAQQQEHNDIARPNVQAVEEERPRLAVVAGSVSVSDDEGAPSHPNRRIWRRRNADPPAVAEPRADGDNGLLQRMVEEAATKIAKTGSELSRSSSKKQPALKDILMTEEKEEKPEARKKDEDEDEDGYMSDSDWLDEPGLQVPSDLLWGQSSNRNTSRAGSNNNSSNNNDNVNDNAAAGANNANNDDGNDNNNQENNIVEVDETEPSSHAGVPATWYHAAFSLSTCCVGLAVQSPEVEDLEFYNWRREQQQESTGRAQIPSPYHCRSVTALLSIVTAMIYTGASIQINQVDCTKSQTKFAELSKDEKRRQFESRLTHALAALIHIAVQASHKRKKAAYERFQRKHGKEPLNVEDSLRLQAIRRKVKLFPTCAWIEDPNEQNALAALGNNNAHDTNKIETSSSHMEDIFIFVKSSIRKFMSKGGVALFLETILRIHGKGVVARMLKRTQAKQSQSDDRKQDQQGGAVMKTASAESSGSTTTSIATMATSNDDNDVCRPLIHCTCCERQEAILKKKPIPPSIRNNLSKLLDMTPPGTDCMTVELVSLLLTGKIHNSWQGWSTDGLGFGILTTSPDTIDCRLVRPRYPVWVLQGPTCYSSIWLDPTGKENEWSSIAHLDKPGAVLQLVHWNGWYGKERKQSSMRLTLTPGEWKPPTERQRPFLLENKRQMSHKNVRGSNDKNDKQSREEHKKARERLCFVSKEELGACQPHPEDMKFYPIKYQLWRYSIGVDDDKNGGKMWLPYYRLNPRQKMIAEMKSGPKIKSILWTRFPKATIDHYTPDDEHPPIV